MSESTLNFSLGPIKINWTIEQTIFYGFLALLLLIMLPIAWTVGISGDERIQYEYGQAILDWFVNFGAPEEASRVMVLESNNGIHTYSSSFDFLTATFNEIFGIENEYEVRHLFNALTGWLLILMTGLLAKEVLGWRAAIIAALFMFLSPRLLGHSWNNPKDIPFAFTYILGLYFILKLVINIDNPGWKRMLWAALAIGSSIGIRIGGLILIAYLFLFAGLYILVTSGGIKNLFTADGIKRIQKSVFTLAAVSIGAYLVGIMFWPFALDNPISNPMTALSEMSDYAIRTGIRQLYQGKIVWSDHLPAYYTLHYIFMTTPVVIILGFFASLPFITKKDHDYSRFWKFALLFAFIFPIFYIWAKGSMVYSGWRHTLFTYPSMAALAAIGVEYLIRKIKTPKAQWIAVACLPILLIHPLWHTIKNNPFQYIYFNEIIGSVDKTVGKYENDYYYHSSKEAYDWIVENEDLSQFGNGKKLRIATNDYFSLRYFVRNDTARQVAIYKRYYERGDQDWDYYVCVNNYINPGQLKKGLWPPANTVYEVKVDNTTICAVLKRKTFKDTQGYLAVQQGDLANGIRLLEEALAEDPGVESAYLNLANAYLRAGQFDKGIETTKKLLKIYPKYDKAFYTQSVIYLNQGKLKESIVAAKAVIKQNPKFDQAYYIMAVGYSQGGDVVSGIKYANMCIEGMPGFKPAYQLLAELYARQGNKEAAAHYQNIVKQIP